MNPIYYVLVIWIISGWALNIFVFFKKEEKLKYDFKNIMMVLCSPIFWIIFGIVALKEALTGK